MNRRERRLWKKKTRRIGVALASLALLGASLGLTGLASANNGVSNNDGPGNFDNCTKVGQSNGFGWETSTNKSFHACDL
jgi:hypothetical protein